MGRVRTHRIRPPRPPCPLERAERAAVFAWRDLWIPRIPALRMLYHSAQGELFRKSHGRPPIPGLSSGIPDINWPVPRGGYHGLWIELKRLRGGHLTDEQRWWQMNLRDQGHFVVTARGADRAIHWILRYYGGTGLTLGGGEDER